jgi:hypothetical protein
MVGAVRPAAVQARSEGPDCQDGEPLSMRGAKFSDTVAAL